MALQFTKATPTAHKIPPMSVNIENSFKNIQAMINETNGIKN